MMSTPNKFDLIFSTLQSSLLFDENSSSNGALLSHVASNEKQLRFHLQKDVLAAYNVKLKKLEKEQHNCNTRMQKAVIYQNCMKQKMEEFYKMSVYRCEEHKFSTKRNLKSRKIEVDKRLRELVFEVVGEYGKCILRNRQRTLYREVCSRVIQAILVWKLRWDRFAYRLCFEVSAGVGADKSSNAQGKPEDVYELLSWTTLNPCKDAEEIEGLCKVMTKLLAKSTALLFGTGAEAGMNRVTSVVRISKKTNSGGDGGVIVRSPSNPNCSTGRRHNPDGHPLSPHPGTLLPQNITLIKTPAALQGIISTLRKSTRKVTGVPGQRLLNAVKRNNTNSTSDISHSRPSSAPRKSASTASKLEVGASETVKKSSVEANLFTPVSLSAIEWMHPNSYNSALWEKIFNKAGVPDVPKLSANVAADSHEGDTNDVNVRQEENEDCYADDEDFLSPNKMMKEVKQKESSDQNTSVGSVNSGVSGVLSTGVDGPMEKEQPLIDFSTIYTAQHGSFVSNSRIYFCLEERYCALYQDHSHPVDTLADNVVAVSLRILQDIYIRTNGTNIATLNTKIVREQLEGTLYVLQYLEKHRKQKKQFDSFLANGSKPPAATGGVDEDGNNLIKKALDLLQEYPDVIKVSTTNGGVLHFATALLFNLPETATCCAYDCSSDEVRHIAGKCPHPNLIYATSSCTPLILTCFSLVCRLPPLVAGNGHAPSDDNTNMIPRKVKKRQKKSKADASTVGNRPSAEDASIPPRKDSDELPHQYMLMPLPSCCMTELLRWYDMLPLQTATPEPPAVSVTGADTGAHMPRMPDASGLEAGARIKASSVRAASFVDLLPDYALVRQSTGQSAGTNETAFQHAYALVHSHHWSLQEDNPSCYYFVQYLPSSASSNGEIDDPPQPSISAEEAVKERIFQDMLYMYSRGDCNLDEDGVKVSKQREEVPSKGGKEKGSVGSPTHSMSSKHVWDSNILGSLCRWRSCVSSDTVISTHPPASSFLSKTQEHKTLCAYHHEIKSFMDNLGGAPHSSVGKGRDGVIRERESAMESNKYLPRKPPQIPHSDAHRDKKLIYAASSLMIELSDGKIGSTVKAFARKSCEDLLAKRQLENNLVLTGHMIREGRKTAGNAALMYGELPSPPSWARWKKESTLIRHMEMVKAEHEFANRIHQMECEVSADLKCLADYNIYPSAELALMRKDIKAYKDLEHKVTNAHTEKEWQAEGVLELRAAEYKLCEHKLTAFRARKLEEQDNVALQQRKLARNNAQNPPKGDLHF